MAHIGLLTLYATGHLNPSIALARALERSGHTVVFFNLPDTEPAISAAGLRFIPYGTADFAPGSLRGVMKQAAELTGQAAFAYYLERMSALFRAAFTDLPHCLRAERLDLLVVDQVFYAGGTLAEHVGVPYVSLANALPVNREEYIPPPVMLWPFEESEAAAARNAKGWAGVDQLFAGLLAEVNAQRAAWTLPAYGNLLEDSFSPLAQICQQPESFDFPRRDAPASMHWVGHLRDESDGQDIAFPWEWLDGRPLVYASCGTLQNWLEPVYRTMIEACAKLDAQTVIALGRNALSPADFGSVPRNVRLVEYAPQRALLGRATLCITHGGMNTTLDALEAGVPMVVIPLASEQPGNAVRVKWLGVGTFVPLADLTAATLGAAIEEVWGTPECRKQAKAVALELAKSQPLAEAVRVVEEVLGRQVGQGTLA